jgi:hypothetical protein
MIGASMDEEKLKQTLDACLLTDAEWSLWEETMQSSDNPEQVQEALMERFEGESEDWELWPALGEEHDDEDHH